MKLTAFQTDGTKTLWKLQSFFGLWLGRVDPNTRLRWVLKKSHSVALSKRSIEQRYPKRKIEWVSYYD